MTEQTVKKLSPKDFESSQEVRWCPGCGDYAILKGVQMALANTGADPKNTVFVSGIGCSSRFPYYISTYGFHTIHGRAPAFATGVKIANPELDVWLVTGDGDGLSIGGNHMLHVLRRNVNMQIMLFNNEIYGLTKGQYSPTSKQGIRTPSTPMGSVDAPLSPCSFAMGAGARFVARTVDTALKDMPKILARAKEHIGASFVEIYQNCMDGDNDVQVLNGFLDGWKFLLSFSNQICFYEFPFCFCVTGKLKNEKFYIQIQEETHTEYLD